jgi:hypothetical protein
MRRREFIAGLGSTVAWSTTAQAQHQQTTVPVIGFLDIGSPETTNLAAFRKGLSGNRLQRGPQCGHQIPLGV